MNSWVNARRITSQAECARSVASLAYLHRPAKEFTCLRPRIAREDADSHVRAYAYWLARVDDGDVDAHIARRAEEWGLTVDDLISGDNPRRLASPRGQLAWEILNHISPDMTLFRIGKILGGRDHSTIASLISCYEREMAR